MGLNSSRSEYYLPSSWITSARHYTQVTTLVNVVVYTLFFKLLYEVGLSTYHSQCSFNATTLRYYYLYYILSMWDSNGLSSISDHGLLLWGKFFPISLSVYRRYFYCLHQLHICVFIWYLNRQVRRFLFVSFGSLIYELSVYSTREIMFSYSHNVYGLHCHWYC